MDLFKNIFDNKIFQFFYGILKFVLSLIIIVYVVFVMAQRLSGNSSIAGYRVFTVATGSMKPIYNINDVIVVKDVDKSTLKVGDDIAYLGKVADYKGKMITHRIIKIEEQNGVVVYQTQGVAADEADPTIREDQIYGKVIGKLAVINVVNHVLKTQVGFFFIIFVPLVLVIFLEIADTIVQMKIDRDELRLIENNKNKTKKNDDDEII